MDQCASVRHEAWPARWTRALARCEMKSWLRRLHSTSNCDGRERHRRHKRLRRQQAAMQLTERQTMTKESAAQKSNGDRGMAIGKIALGPGLCLLQTLHVRRLRQRAASVATPAHLTGRTCLTRRRSSCRVLFQLLLSSFSACTPHSTNPAPTSNTTLPLVRCPSARTLHASLDLHCALQLLEKRHPTKTHGRIPVATAHPLPLTELSLSANQGPISVPNIPQTSDGRMKCLHAPYRARPFLASPRDLRPHSVTDFVATPPLIGVPSLPDVEIDHS